MTAADKLLLTWTTAIMAAILVIDYVVVKILL